VVLGVEWCGAVLPVCRDCVLGSELLGNGSVPANSGCSGGDFALLWLLSAVSRGLGADIWGSPTVIRVGAAGGWS
jgi:hypothetical protein